MTEVTNYPADPTKVPRFDVALYIAVALEEFGYPPIVGDDRVRFDALLKEFLYRPVGQVLR